MLPEDRQQQVLIGEIIKLACNKTKGKYLKKLRSVLYDMKKCAKH